MRKGRLTPRSRDSPPFISTVGLVLHSRREQYPYLTTLTTRTTRTTLTNSRNLTTPGTFRRKDAAPYNSNTLREREREREGGRECHREMGAEGGGKSCREEAKYLFERRKGSGK